MTRLRDLDDAAFAAMYGCDRFSATVLANRFAYVVEHMCSRLLTAAFSPILRDFYDFAATITGPPETAWATPAMSNSIVLFTGTMTDSVRNVVEEYGYDRLAPGDVLVANDPYRTGTHVNDVLFCRPVFHGGRLVAFVNLKAHQLDMGGAVPGGFSVAKRTVYENGLVLSPRLLFHRGQPVRETWTLVFDNVRFGEILFPDMQTVCAELELGERLLSETLERYGVGAVHGAMRYVCDAGAERVTEALKAMPDGVWSGEDVTDCDGVDDSEEYRIHVTVIKRGGRLEVDFSGTSRQARTCINATALDVKTAVGIALKYLLDPHGPFTSGLMRPVDIVLPEGTIVSALPPDGAVFLYYEQSLVMMSALLRALAGALGPDAMAGDRGGTGIHNAFGTRADGSPWVSVAQCGGEIGPFGANRHGDADSQMFSYLANGIGVAAEAVEADVPVVMLRHEIVCDSAGPGYHRGGAAVVRDSLWLAPAAHSLMTLRSKRLSGFGVNGGGAGGPCGVWVYDPPGNGGWAEPPTGEGGYAGARALAGVIDPETGRPSPDGEFVYPFAQPFVPTAPLSVLRYVCNGGGGWGDPLTREPERVLVDVRDGYVSLEAAAREYGVVVHGDPDLDPEGLVVDVPATSKLRAEHYDARAGMEG
jgi:N-methylhydantoinase B